MSSVQLSEGIKFLAQNGFNLFSITSCRSLPDKIINFFDEQNIEINKFSKLVTIGSGGKRLWEALNSIEIDPIHPVNCFTLNIMDEFLKTYLHGAKIIPLFPKLTNPGVATNPIHFPIQELGHWVGWSHPSPLGKGIHPKYGLWFAYRNAFLTDLDLPETLRLSDNSPCTACERKPCIKACPPNAVSKIVETLTDFDLKTCLQFRLKEDSKCENRCLARMSCPIGREHQYTKEQMTHHYSRSLSTVREKYIKYVYN
jgi:epoxyqueuosine reductase